MWGMWFCACLLVCLRVIYNLHVDHLPLQKFRNLHFQDGKTFNHKIHIRIRHKSRKLNYCAEQNFFGGEGVKKYFHYSNLHPDVLASLIERQLWQGHDRLYNGVKLFSSAPVCTTKPRDKSKFPIKRSRCSAESLLLFKGLMKTKLLIFLVIAICLPFKFRQ